MARCVVNGCNVYRKRDTNTHITLHGFPNNSFLIKTWLLQTGQDFGDIDDFVEKVKAKKKYYRICSWHFTPDSYYVHGIQKRLKPDAIPTIFKVKVSDFVKNEPEEYVQPPLDEQHSENVLEWKVKTEIELDNYTVTHTQEPNVYHNYCSPNVSQQMPEIKKYKNASTYTTVIKTQNKMTCTKSASGFRNAQTQTLRNLTFTVSTSTKGLVKNNNVGMWTGQEYQDKCTSTMIDNQHLNNAEGMECPNSPSAHIHCKTKIDVNSTPVETEEMTDKSKESVHDSKITKEEIKDAYYVPEDDVDYDDSFDNMITVADHIDEHKYFVFDSCLNSLISKLSCSYTEDCKAPFCMVDKKHNGTLLIIYVKCTKGHYYKLWEANP